MSDVIRINKKVRENINEYREILNSDKFNEYAKEVYKNMSDAEILSCMTDFACWAYKKFMI